MGGTFDRVNWQYSGKLDQNFSKKSNTSGFARGGGGGEGGFGIDRYMIYFLHLIKRGFFSLFAIAKF